MQQFITDRLPQIEELCRTYNVQRLSIFGSAVRTDFNIETSDVDFTVQFQQGVTPAQSWGVFDLQTELEAMLSRKVDLVRLPIRNSYLRRAVEKSEVRLYGA